jgi:lantibiotic modifying enzyme
MNSALIGDEASRAVEIAVEIATRLRDPHAVHNFLAPTHNYGAEWSSSDLASGCAGIAILMASLALACEKEWSTEVKAHLSWSTRGCISSCGLFPGWAGLLASVEFCGWALPGAYIKLREQLRSLIQVGLKNALAEDKNLSLSNGEFLCGLGGVLMSLGADNRYGDSVPYRRLLKMLERISSEPYDSSQINFGLAHGTAGVVLTLAQGCSWGLFSAEDLSRCIHTDLLVQEAATSIQGAPWLKNRSRQQRRVGWCHGAPGTALSLWQVGTVLDCDDLKKRAIMCLDNALDNGSATWGMKDACLCHGLAGNALIFHWFAQKTQQSRYHELAADLARQTLLHFKPSLPVGYVFYDTRDRPYHDPGLLQGASGIALALLTLSGACSFEWARVLGILDL